MNTKTTETQMLTIIDEPGYMENYRQWEPMESIPRQVGYSIIVKRFDGLQIVTTVRKDGGRYRPADVADESAIGWRLVQAADRETVARGAS
jgi:hypothetical protein